MATHLRIPKSWIYFAVLVLVSFVHVPAYAQCVHSPTFTFTDETCPGANDGTITVTVQDGTAPFAYQLEKRSGLTEYTLHETASPIADRTYTFTGLSRGSYRVQVFDSQIDECGPTPYVFPVLKTLGTTPADVTISGPAEVCEGQTGVTYSVALTAGSSYSWGVPAGATITSGATGPENNTVIVSFGSTGGPVTVTETNTGGCSGNEASLNVTVIPTPAKYTLSTTDPLTFCEGSTGANLTLSNSDLGITYVLLHNNVEVNTLAGSGSALAFGAYNVSGTYTAMAYVTSSSSCTATMDGSVTLTATAPATLSTLVTNVSCSGGTDGSIDLTITGGTAPFSILWSTGATTEDISGLTAGVYKVSVTDASGCLVEASVEVGSAEPLNLTPTIKQVSCFDAKDGSIDLLVSGGTAPYTYAWSNGATTEDVSGLDAGTYTIIVTDANNCTINASYEITQPTLLTASAAVLKDATCFGGSDGAIDLTVNGGTASYTYLWSNGATTEDISGLTAGTYTVTVTDGNGCTTTAEATVAQPAALASTAAVTDATTCGGNEGSIDLEISGGTAPYTYLWNTGATSQDLFNLIAGTYTVTITDSKSCVLEASVTVGQPSGISSLSAGLTHVSCNGAANGAVDLTVNGGTAPYTYAWSNGATTEDLSGLAPGTYSVTVTDATNCQLNQSFEVIEPAVLTLNGVATDINCAGNNNGQIDITVSGGTAPYTYAWSNGATTEDLTNLSAGIYEVSVLDANACEVKASYTIKEGTAIILSSSLTHIICNGDNTGAIDLTVAEGTAPYTYAWSNGATTEDLSGLTAGTYTVTVSDANSCSAIASLEITETGAINLSTSLTQITTCGGSDGAIDLTVSGGTAPYTYSWSNGATTEDLNGLAAGTYTVTVTDANACQVQTSAVINEPSSITAAEGALTHVTCFGTNTGAIDLSVSGGTAPYTYAWSNGATTEDISGLAAGTYSVTVTDTKSCSFTNSFTITEPAALNLSAQLTQISCKGAATGAIDLTVEGGTAAYRYSWSNGATTQDLIDIVAGVYTVIVTDANDCRQTAEYTISEPENALIASATATHVSCNGGTNGSVDLSVSGGTVNYTYLWSNGATTEDLTNVAAGTYTVSITDAGGCTVTASADVSEPAALTATVSGTTILCSGEVNGRLTVAAEGGTAAYRYLWNTGEITASIENLSAGTYTVEVTDANGCRIEVSHVISELAAIELATMVTNVSSCSGNDGAIDLSVTAGGLAPFTYQWSNGATTEDISSLSAGTYTVTVTDANGCSQTASATVTQPVVLELTATATNATSCGGTQGSVDLTVAGGLAPYAYSWNNGATTEDISNLSAGTYTVIVTDANGCTETISATVAEPISNVVVTAVTTDVACHGLATGAIDITVDGGIAPYTYLWSNGATTEDISNLSAGEYTVTAKDANGCSANGSFTISEPAIIALTALTKNTSSCGAADGGIDLTVSGGTAPYTYSWSNGAVTEDVSGLTAGNYTVTVTDANGCTQTASYSISDGNGPALTASVQHNSCFGDASGAVELTVSGGLAPYTYEWNTGATSKDIADLPAGTYSVTVTDANGCLAALTAVVEEPTAITVSAEATAVKCFGGSDGTIKLTVSGGIAPYQFAWTKDGASIQASTKDLSDLAAGEYAVTITDANGCAIQSSTIITQPAALTATISGTNSLCAGSTDGSLTVTASGGTEPYTYNWNTGATTATISNLTAGTYSVTVTDANNCSITLSHTISENLVVVNLGDDIEACKPAEIVLNAGYSTDTHSIVWSKSDGSILLEDASTITVSTTDTYSVTVTDRATGCAGTDSILVEIEDLFEPTISVELAEEFTCNSSELVLEAVYTRGGNAPTFVWSKNFEVLAGEISNTLRLPVGTFEAGDVITVEMVSSLECASPKTVVTDEEHEVHIIAFPEVKQPQLSSYDESVCEGRTMPTFTSTDGEMLNWYQDVPGGTPIFVGVEFTPTQDMLQLGDNTFYATYRSTICDNPHISFNVTLKAEGECGPACEVTPTVAVRILPSKEICDDIKTLKLHADVDQVGENVTYAWFFNGASTPFSTEASPAFTKAEGFVTGDVFKVEVTITDQAFICDGKNMVSDTESITVVPQVQATVSILPIEAVCADSSTPVTLTAEGEYVDWRFAGLATRYEWFIGTESVQSSLLDSETSTANQLVIVPNQLPANAQVRLVVTLPDGISCVLPPAEAIYDIPFAEPVAPTVSLSSSAPNGACPGTSITFTASATNAGTNPTFVFLVDDAEVQRGISSNFVLSAPQHGQRVLAKVLVTDATGLCLSTTEASSTEQTVRILTTEECVGGSFNCGVFGAELISFTRPSCGERNGALYYEISGGSPSYFIRYSFAGEQVEQVVNQTSFTLAIERIPAGEVTIYMRDSKGNECSLTTILESEPQLAISFEKSTNGDVICFGEATGKARLTVEGGNAPYQYLLEGATEWQTLNGNSIEFTNLPAGIINILVRDGEADACPAVASLEILNANPEIQVETSITANANCNDKVGAFALDNVTGGAGSGYRVKLAGDDNWQTYSPGMLFSGLARGAHTLIINDGVCEVNKTIMVPSPGDIIVTTEDIAFSCDAPDRLSGLRLKIGPETNFSIVGNSFDATLYKLDAQGVKQQVGSPDRFTDKLEIYKIERGTYYVIVSSVNGNGCPENLGPFNIEGSDVPSLISFKAEPVVSCDNEDKWLRISELKGDELYAFHVIVRNIANAAPQETVTISRADYELAYKRDGYWDIPVEAFGAYEMRIEQDQTSCDNNESSAMSGIIRVNELTMLNVTLSGTTVSLPERGTGTLSFRIGNGTGSAPYEASLVWKARLETQEDWAFESYGDPVPMNGTTGKYDYTYSNLPPGEYELTVTDSKGCSVVLTETIDFDTNVFVPNFISPNGDGKNDVFYIRNKAANTQLIITNRWGKVVYESKNYNNDWDGGSLPEGLYYYSIKLPLSEGGNIKGWLQIKRGAMP